MPLGLPERRFFNSVKSAPVNKSTKTLSLPLSNALRNMLTKTANRLKLPVLLVMSSIYLELNSPHQRAPDCVCSISMSRVLLWFELEEDKCEACDSGKYSTGVGESSPAACQNCPLGFYQPVKATPFCLPCSPGTDADH